MFKKDLLAPMYAHTFQRAKRENLEGVSLQPYHRCAACVSIYFSRPSKIFFFSFLFVYLFLIFRRILRTRFRRLSSNNSEKCLRKSPYSLSYSLCCGYKNAMISRPTYYTTMWLFLLLLLEYLLSLSCWMAQMEEEVEPRTSHPLSHHITICIPERDCWASSSSSVRAPSYFSSRV